MAKGLDPDILTRVASGDHDAFTALYDATATRIYRYLVSYGAHESLVADIVQETFLVVWRDARKYRGPSPIAWMLGIARNKVLTAYRRQPPGAEDGVNLDEMHHPAHRVDVAYAEVRATEILSGLTASDRELAHLVFVQDLSYQEVSRLVNVPTGTIKSRVFRIRRQLQEQEDLGHDTH